MRDFVTLVGFAVVVGVWLVGLATAMHWLSDRTPSVTRAVLNYMGFGLERCPECGGSGSVVSETAERAEPSDAVAPAAAERITMPPSAEGRA